MCTNFFAQKILLLSGKNEVKKGRGEMLYSSETEELGERGKKQRSSKGSLFLFPVYTTDVCYCGCLVWLFFSPPFCHNQATLLNAFDMRSATRTSQPSRKGEGIIQLLILLSTKISLRFPAKEREETKRFSFPFLYPRLNHFREKRGEKEEQTPLVSCMRSRKREKRRRRGVESATL